MTKAAKGQQVKVHYTGKLDDGTVFDSSIEREPLAFTLGSGEVIPGFDNGVMGLALNETRTVVIPAAEAYGAHQPGLVVEFAKSELPPHIKPKLGQRLQMTTGNGILVVTVTAESDTTVTFDGNHALAGKALTFDLQLVDIIR